VKKDLLPLEHIKTKALFRAPREGNCYTLNLSCGNSIFENCFVSNMDESWLWHKRLAHVCWDPYNAAD